MTQDDIIRMAREAGFEKYCRSSLSGDSELDETLQVAEFPVGEIVFKFAALVAAAERKRLEATAWEASKKWIVEAVAAEREACAKVCETEGLGAKYQGDVYAEAIRARGEK